MLALIGFITIIVVVGVIMSKKVSPPVSLAVIPVIVACILGYYSEVGGFVTNGIKGVAANVALFTFSVLFFSMMGDVGVFDVLVSRVLKVVGKNPVRICIAVWLIAFISHLDGAGATTALITFGAFLPIFDKMKMDRWVLGIITAMQCGIMNAVPWGGPTMRAMTSLELSSGELFVPMIPVMVFGMVVVNLPFAIFLGKKETKRLGSALDLINIEAPKLEDLSDEERALRRPKLLVVNFILMIITIACLFGGVFNAATVFILAACIALVINFPSLKDQKKIIELHSKDSIMLTSTMLAAGVLIGIFKGTGMMEAMAHAIADAVPANMMGHMPLLIGIFTAPANFFIDADSFYYVILPVLAEASSTAGVAAVSCARAAILGHTTIAWTCNPFIGTTFLFIGMLDIDLGTWQRKSFLILWALSILMLIFSLIIGKIPF